MTLEVLKNVPTDELEKLLEERKKQDTEAQKAKRLAYEERKDALVTDNCISASVIFEEIKNFKQSIFNELRNFYEAMKEYGDVAGANKGNFSIKSADGKYKIEYKRQVLCGFDERANLAEQKLREFLSETVKKKDLPIYELVMGLLERNKLSGDFDSKNIQKLYKMEDKFEHVLWKQAIQLFKESFHEQGTSYYARFFVLDSTGAFQPIDLNFASIKIQ